MTAEWMSLTDASREVRCSSQEIAELADADKIQALKWTGSKITLRWVPEALVRSAVEAGKRADQFAQFAQDWCEKHVVPLPFAAY